MSFRFLLPSVPVLWLVVIAAGCRTTHDAVTWRTLTTQSPYLCCRTLRYSVWEYPAHAPSTIAGEGVTVRLLDDSLRVVCADDMHLGVAVANNSDDDVYIPVSYEIEGTTIKLYPWRWVSTDGRAVRLARQLQFGDMVERELGQLRFLHLPAGRQISFQGIIPRGWLCSPAESVSQEYLDAELNPTFYVDRARGLRALRATQIGVDTLPVRQGGLRFDVAYTTFGFLKGLPVTSEVWNAGHDTLEVRLAVKEEPAQFLNASQWVVKSNVVTLLFPESPGSSHR